MPARSENSIRSAVLDRMQSQRISKYRVAEDVSKTGVCGKQTIYRWLAGTHETSTKVASAVIEYLDLELALTATQS